MKGPDALLRAAGLLTLDPGGDVSTGRPQRRLAGHRHVGERHVHHLRPRDGCTTDELLGLSLAGGVDSRRPKESTASNIYLLMR